jgi:hypothetical protein
LFAWRDAAFSCLSVEEEIEADNSAADNAKLAENLGPVGLPGHGLGCRCDILGGEGSKERREEDGRGEERRGSSDGSLEKTLDWSLEGLYPQSGHKRPDHEA